MMARMAKTILDECFIGVLRRSGGWSFLCVSTVCIRALGQIGDLKRTFFSFRSIFCIQFAIFLGLATISCRAFAQVEARDDSTAVILNEQGKQYKAMDPPDSALASYRASSAMFCRLGNWEEALHSMNNEARVHLERGEHEPARNILVRALSIGREHGDSTGVQMARILELLAFVESYMDKQDSALTRVHEALRILDMKTGKDANSISSLCILGDILYKNGECDEALRYLTRATQVMDALPPEDLNQYQFQIVQFEIGQALNGKGEYLRSIDHLERFFRDQENAGIAIDPIVRATSLFTMGEDYKFLGEYGNAVHAVQTALELNMNRNGIPQNIALCHQLLGDIYLGMGDVDEALSSYRSSLELFEATNGSHHSSVARSLHRISEAYDFRGETDSALAYALRARELFRSATAYQPGLLHALLSETIARLCIKKGDFQTSLTRLDEAIAITQQASGRADGLEIARLYSETGSVYARLGTLDSAEIYLRAALSLEAKGPDHKAQLQSEILRGLGDIDVKRGNIPRGIDLYHQAMSAARDSGAGARFDHDFSSNNALALLKSSKSLSAAYEKKYKRSRSLDDLVKANEALTHAMSILEQHRGTFRSEGSKYALEETNRSLYDDAIRIEMALHTMTGKQEYVYGAFETAERSKAGALLDAIRETDAEHFAGIPDSLVVKEHRLKEELVQCDIDTRRLGQTPAFAERRLSLNNEYHNLLDSFKKDHPSYYALRFNDGAMDLKDVQALLENNTVLVEYHVGEHALTVFTVDGDGCRVTSVRIPADFDRTVTAFGKSIRTVDARKFVEESSALYSFLIEPVASELRGRKLIVVPDGVLWAVPFEALVAKKPADRVPVNFTRLPYLVKQCDISYAYSARTLVHDLRRPRVQGQGFLGVAPVFSDSTSNSVLLADNGFSRGMDSTLLRSVTLDGTRYNPLPYSGEEVTSLESIFRVHGDQSVGLLHQDATEDQFKRSAGKYAYIHVATHGVLDEKHPRFSALLFSPSATSSTEDGVLYASEVYTLDLHADLVVLSSCESGVGRIVGGEGMLSMTRGFFYAGARNVLFSLWKVYDKHTNALMQTFYSDVLDGSSYASALRKAKLELISNPATAFPSKWAAFVLLGSQPLDHQTAAMGSLDDKLPHAK
jgi:CHAT domain-containing protein